MSKTPPATCSPSQLTDAGLNLLQPGLIKHYPLAKSSTAPLCPNPSPWHSKSFITGLQSMFLALSPTASLYPGQTKPFAIFQIATGIPVSATLFCCPPICPPSFPYLPTHREFIRSSKSTLNFQIFPVTSSSFPNQNIVFPPLTLPVSLVRTFLNYSVILRVLGLSAHEMINSKSA